MRTRHRHRALIPAGLALALGAVCGAPLSLGCGSDAPEGLHRSDGGAAIDAGPSVFDAAAPDGPTEPVPDGGFPPASNEDRSSDGVVGCFDFVDTDLDGLVDCFDDDCAARPICCVGSSSDECCHASASASIGVAFDGCAGAGTTALATCADGATLFGSPTPELRDGAMIPLGDERFDSGLVLATTLDPRASLLTIGADITSGETCAGCIDSVAFGLSTAQGSYGTTTLVDPDVALMVSASQGEVRLVIGGAVARAIEITRVHEQVGAAPGDSIRYELTTTPGGLASVDARAAATIGESVRIFTDVPYAPRGPAQVVIWGRSTNRAAEDPAPSSIGALDVASSTCDAPASLERASARILPDAIDAWWPRDARVSAPSVVRYEVEGTPRSMMAFEHARRIHLAGGIEGGRFRALADPMIEANAVLRATADTWCSGGVTDPQLVRAENHWEIWFTAIGETGARSIARAIGEPGYVLQFPTISRVLPADAASTDEWDGASYLETTIGADTRRFLAARRTSSAGTAIVLHELNAGDGSLAAASATRFDSDAGEAVDGDVVHQAPTAMPATFDADELAAPALVRYAGVLRLYYAGRRGTRWSIGVLLSEDGRHWHAANDAQPVLTGSGAGFDALSVSDPEPVLEGGQLRLYHRASDGVGSVIGVATHRVPDEVVP
ncbi:MAG: hypothetical protein M3Y87_23635 [Myxococcota bacterium]|nr:hypothetical protein [Myxococcota bacterium]